MHLSFNQAHNSIIFKIYVCEKDNKSSQTRNHIYSKMNPREFANMYEILFTTCVHTIVFF